MQGGTRTARAGSLNRVRPPRHPIALTFQRPVRVVCQRAFARSWRSARRLAHQLPLLSRDGTGKDNRHKDGVASVR
jgi:hypothetical protein